MTKKQSAADKTATNGSTAKSGAKNQQAKTRHGQSGQQQAEGGGAKQGLGKKAR